MPACKRVNCLLLDGFSLLACSSATEPLMACNKLISDSIYTINYIAFTNSVRSDTDLNIAIDRNLSDEDFEPNELIGDILIICGGSPANYACTDQQINDIARMCHQHQTIIGAGTGSFALAQAGILNGRKASVHWWSLNQLRKQFPDIMFSTDLFSLDGSIATCRGGSASFDLMLTLLSQAHGKEIIEALSQYFLRERMGISREHAQRFNLEPQAAQEHPQLEEAIQLMLNNIDEPLSTEDIAKHIALSKRQLERLFKKHLNEVPSRYYLIIRLEHARNQLLSKQDSITEIALASGFSSTAHFSASYRNFYGLTPSEERTMQNK